MKPYNQYGQTQYYYNTSQNNLVGGHYGTTEWS